VAFANSVAPGDTARIFVGEKDDGTVQGVTNADNIQKRIKKEADEIYPEIYYRTEVYERDRNQCVRVDIKQNGLAPHFGGAAWVRRASTSVPATEALYQQLIDVRSSKVRELTEWIGEKIVVSWSAALRNVPGPSWSAKPCELVNVTAHFSTFRRWKSSRANDCGYELRRKSFSRNNTKKRQESNDHRINSSFPTIRQLPA
jgi:hypothetical protein